MCDSSHSSRGSGASTSDSNEPVTNASAKSRSTPTRSESSNATGPTCHDSGTSGTSKRTTSQRLNCGPEGFLARTSVSLDDVPAFLAHRAAFGLNSLDWFARFNQDSSSWKTRQALLCEDWIPSSVIFPLWGMTRSGIASQLPPSVPITYELESGFLPTPLATQTGRSLTRYIQGGWRLSAALGGRVNPAFKEWMMGLPYGWTDIESAWSVSPSSRKSSKRSQTKSGPTKETDHAEEI